MVNARMGGLERQETTQAWGRSLMDRLGVIDTRIRETQEQIEKTWRSLQLQPQPVSMGMATQGRGEGGLDREHTGDEIDVGAVENNALEDKDMDEEKLEVVALSSGDLADEDDEAASDDAEEDEDGRGTEDESTGEEAGTPVEINMIDNDFGEIEETDAEDGRESPDSEGKCQREASSSVTGHSVSPCLFSPHLRLAFEFFEWMGERSRVTWIEIIQVFARDGDMVTARRMFEEVPQVVKYMITWTVVINGDVENGEMEQARKVFKNMPERNFYAWSGMTSSYGKIGDVWEAKLIFDRISVKNMMNWNSRRSECLSVCMIGEFVGQRMHNFRWFRKLRGCDQENGHKEGKDNIDVDALLGVQAPKFSSISMTQYKATQLDQMEQGGAEDILLQQILLQDQDGELEDSSFKWKQGFLRRKGQLVVENKEEKLIYKCKYSFLEIYKEQNRTLMEEFHSLQEIIKWVAQLGNTIWNLQRGHLSFISMINIVQSQDIDLFPEEAVKTLNSIKDVASILWELSKEFKSDRFLTPFIGSLIELSLANALCRPTLVSLIETVQIGNILDHIIFKILLYCIKLSWKVSDTALQEYGQRAKSISVVVTKKYSYGLNSVVRKFLQEPKFSSAHLELLSGTMSKVVDNSQSLIMRFTLEKGNRTFVGKDKNAVRQLMSLDQGEEIYRNLGKLAFVEPAPKDNEAVSWKERLDPLYKNSSQSYKVVVHGFKMFHCSQSIHSAKKQRTDRGFAIGKLIYVKLQSHKQLSAGPYTNQGLASVFYWPYKMLDRIRGVPYKLDLSAESAIHPILHVFRLRRNVQDQTRVLAHVPNFGMTEVKKSVAILQRRMGKRKSRATTKMLTKWSDSNEEDATWEILFDLMQKFAHLRTSVV